MNFWNGLIPPFPVAVPSKSHDAMPPNSMSAPRQPPKFGAPPGLPPGFSEPANQPRIENMTMPPPSTLPKRPNNLPDLNNNYMNRNSPNHLNYGPNMPLNMPSHPRSHRNSGNRASPVMMNRRHNHWSLFWDS